MEEDEADLGLPGGNAGGTANPLGGVGLLGRPNLGALFNGLGIAGALAGLPGGDGIDLGGGGGTGLWGELLDLERPGTGGINEDWILGDTPGATPPPMGGGGGGGEALLN